MEEQSENVTEIVVIDVLIFAVLAAFNLYAAKFLKPTIRGFFCDDESIRYPAFESTVPSLLLHVVGIAVPVAFILLFEFLNKRQNRKEFSPYRIGKHKIPSLYWNIYKMLIIYCSGAVFNQTLTDLGKKVIGRLRPNFLDICKPPLDILCANPTYSLIEHYECQPKEGINPDISRVSFPSGHSSFAFYAAVFLVLYLQKRFKTKTTIAKPILQFTIIAVAWFTALSRVMNNKHHWSDVLAGILLGSTVAIINTIFVHRIFDSNEYHHQPVSEAPNVMSPGNGVPNEAHAQL